MATTKTEPSIWDDKKKMATVLEHMERTTGFYATELCEHIDLAAHAGDLARLDILDLGCGSAIATRKALTQLDAAARAKTHFTCADIADSMLETARSRLADVGWHDVDFVRVDAQDTKLPPAAFSHVLWTFGPMVLSDSVKGVAECYRVLKPGGVFACATWEYIPWTEDVHVALSKVAELPEFPRTRGFTRAFSKSEVDWVDVDEVTAHIEKAGFVDVSAKSVKCVTTVKSIAEMEAMLPFILGNGLKSVWSQADVEKHSDAAKTALLDYYREKYGDGEITWNWTAIVTGGRKPEP